MEIPMSRPPKSWQVAGSYFEVCNCEAVCPCRWEGVRRKGQPSTYELCDFALSWRITDGAADEVDLAGCSVMMAGTYSNHVVPRTPWRVVLYLDDQASQAQCAALEDVFLGRAGGTTMRNFAAGIGEVFAVRRAHLELDHAPGHERMRAAGFVSAATDHPAQSSGEVSCGIPGHDRPGQEIVAKVFRVDDPPLRWEVTGRCGFASDFAYRSSD
jgi:hypothetical protein